MIHTKKNAKIYGGNMETSADEQREQIYQQKKAKDYEKYVKEVTPTTSLWRNMVKAFITGGIICMLGQWIQNVYMNYGLEKEEAGTWMLITLVFLSVVLTSLNIFPKIVTWGGAGALVPITGFANGVVAPAIEYQSHVCVILVTSQKNLKKISGFDDVVLFYSNLEVMS